jgi:hypothetical protein
MEQKTIKLILGIYMAVAIAICGFFYINPRVIYANDSEWISSFGQDRVLDIDYSRFQYSVVAAIASFVLLYSILQFKKSNRTANTR